MLHYHCCVLKSTCGGGRVLLTRVPGLQSLKFRWEQFCEEGRKEWDVIHNFLRVMLPQLAALIKMYQVDLELDMHYGLHCHNPENSAENSYRLFHNGFKSHARDQQNVLAAGGDVFLLEPLDAPDNWYSRWGLEDINLDKYFRTDYWELLAPILTSLRLENLFTEEIPQGRLDWLLLLRNLQVLEIRGTCPTQTLLGQSGGVAAGMQCTQNRAFSRLCVCRLVNTGAHHLPRTTQLPSSEKIDSSSIHPWRTLQPGLPLT